MFKSLAVLSVIIAAVSAVHEPVHFWAKLANVNGAPAGWKGLCNGRYVLPTTADPVRRLFIYCVHNILPTGDTVTASHLHGTAGPNGAAANIYTLNIGTTEQNPIYASYSAGLTILNEDDERAFFAGLYYVVIHTSGYSGGALRGQFWPFGHPAAPNPPTYTAQANDVQAGTATAPGNFTQCGILHARRSGGTSLSAEWVWSGLNGANSMVTAMHIHTGAFGASGGILQTLCDNTTPTNCSPRYGTAAFTGDNNAVAMDAAGTYWNVHTNDFGGGQIRGQINPPSTTIAGMNRFFGDDAPNFYAELMPVPGSNCYGYSLFYYDVGMRMLKSYVAHNCTASNQAHVHGPADMGENAGVIWGYTGAGNMNWYTGSWGPINSAQEGWLYAGSLYVNVHNTAFPGGATRGQIMKWGSSGAPVAVALLNNQQSNLAVSATQGGIAWWSAVSAIPYGNYIYTGVDTLAGHIHGDAPSTPASPGSAGIIDTLPTMGGAGVQVMWGVPSSLSVASLTNGQKYVAIHEGVVSNVPIRGQVRTVVAPAPQRWTDNADSVQLYANLASLGTGGGTGACAIWYSKTYKSLRVICAHSCASATLAHFHGPILDTESIGTDSSNLWLTMTMRPNSAAGTNSMVFEGTMTGISAADEAKLLNARFYVNIHNSALPGGCARGQIYRTGFSGPTQNLPGPTHVAVMDDRQAGKGPTTADATMDTGRIGVALLWKDDGGVAGKLRTMQTWSGLSGTPSQAHIHGPGAVSSWFPTSAGIVWAMSSVGTSAAASTADTFTGATAGQYADLDAGNMYYNVHTAAAPGGEIRGQVTPVKCYPYGTPAANCPVNPAVTSSSSSSSTGSSTAMPGAAATLTVSAVFVAVLAVLAVLLQ